MFIFKFSDWKKKKKIFKNGNSSSRRIIYERKKNWQKYPGEKKRNEDFLSFIFRKKMEIGKKISWVQWSMTVKLQWGKWAYNKGGAKEKIHFCQVSHTYRVPEAPKHSARPLNLSSFSHLIPAHFFFFFIFYLFIFPPLYSFIFFPFLRVLPEYIFVNVFQQFFFHYRPRSWELVDRVWTEKKKKIQQ